jgi:hypothetical protein
VRFGALGHPGWDGRSVHTVSDTGDDSGDDELSETARTSATASARSESCNGEDGTNNHDDTASEHHPASTHPFPDEEGEEGTEEAADFIDRNDRTLQGCSVDIVVCALVGLKISSAPVV